MRGLTTPRGLADVSVSKNLHIGISSLENFGKNALKCNFLFFYNDAQKHEGFVGFKKTLVQSNGLRHSNITK